MRMALANLLLAAFMVGVIWLVQLVVYPMFMDAGPEAFPAWETEHSRRIQLVVGPAILLQLVVALALVARSVDDAAERRLCAANLLALLVAVGATGLVSVPLHDELSGGFSASTIDTLVQTNWIRTAAWSLQLLPALVLAGRASRLPPR